MATNSRRLVHFSILGIAGTIVFASVANADPVGVALAWISTEMDSANIMSLRSTIFRAFRSEATVTCYASWCADSLVARRHFALSRFDFRSFRVSGGKMTPGRDGYQSTNMPNTNERIPESHESLADSNVRGICFRGNPG